MKTFIMVLGLIVTIVLAALWGWAMGTLFAGSIGLVLMMSILGGGVIGFGCSKIAIAIIERMDDYDD